MMDRSMRCKPPPSQRLDLVLVVMPTAHQADMQEHGWMRLGSLNISGLALYGNRSGAKSGDQG
ncbi:MAG: hypothetical protein ABW076_02660 [Candidatus Thiodiazotropha sp.]